VCTAYLAHLEEKPLLYSISVEKSKFVTFSSSVLCICYMLFGREPHFQHLCLFTVSVLQYIALSEDATLSLLFSIHICINVESSKQDCLSAL